MTVRKKFEDEKLDLEFIETNFDGSYWEKCDDFITSNWERDIDSLSEKQLIWFFNILGDCTEKRIEG